MAQSRPARIVRANRLTFLRWLLSVIGFGVAGWGLVEGIGEWSLPHIAWVVFASGMGVFFLVHSVREWRERHAGPSPELVTRQIWRYVGPYASWQTLGAGRTHAVYSPQLNRRLAAGEPIAVEVGGEWTPEGRAGQFRAHQLQKLKLNEPKFRLASDLLEDSTTVCLQTTDYASFMATNRLAYEAWWDSKIQEYHLTFPMVETSVVENGTLPRLVNSRSSNHLGGDLLAVGDGFTYLQKQRTTALMYGGHWVASASGSFDLGDLTPSRNLQDLVKTGLLRELAEEMSLPADQVPGLEASKVLGYSRATYLGGKPQFYGVARIGRVTPGGDAFTDRFHRLDFEDGAEGLIAALEEFAVQHEDQLSPPLQMLIRVVSEWLRADPHASEWLWPRATS